MKTKAKVRGYAFVIKENGMPRIDDPRSVPQADWDTLSKTQQNYANDNVPEGLRR